MLESNVQQAALPVACEILPNNYGTAAGMMFEKNGRYCVSLPGVPYEMKGIVLEELMPRLVQRFQLKAMFHYTILTQGIGESFLAEQIADWEDRIREASFLDLRQLLNVQSSQHVYLAGFDGSDLVYL